MKETHMQPPHDEPVPGFRQTQREFRHAMAMRALVSVRLREVTERLFTLALALQIPDGNAAAFSEATENAAHELDAIRLQLETLVVRTAIELPAPEPVA